MTVSSPVWRCRGLELNLSRPLLMGVINVTPDSFSDGGHFLDPADAFRHAEQMAEEGAHILDIGGESSRPGAKPVSEAEELERGIPVVREVAALGLPVSVDTVKPTVAAAAIEAGAAIINDITALQDPEMARVVSDSGAGVVLMHMQGTPGAMQENPRYHKVVSEVRDFLRERRQRALAAGVNVEAVVLDPGIGFGKTLEHNLKLLSSLQEIVTLGSPVLVGLSRKRFIGSLTAASRPEDRGPGSVAAVLAARARGASIFRVHDVAATRQAMTVFQAIDRPSPR